MYLEILLWHTYPNPQGTGMVGGNRRCPYLSQNRRRIEKLFMETGEHLEILGLTTRSDRTVASMQQEVIIEMAKRRKGVVEVDHFVN
jgi:hypothetical protein